MLYSTSGFYEHLGNCYNKVVEWNALAGNEQEGKIEKYKELVAEEVDEYYNAENKVDRLKELVDCLVVTSYLWHLSNKFEYESYDEKITAALEFLETAAETLQLFYFDVIEAFRRVNESNFSKFSRYREDMESVYDEHCKYLEQGGRYSNVTWTKNDKYVIWWSGDGKVLKGPSYQEPYLDDLV